MYFIYFFFLADICDFRTWVNARFIFNFLQVDVIKANGEASSNLPLTVTCEGETEDKAHLLSPLTSPSENNVYWTDSSGHLVVDYFIASDISRLLFKVSEMKVNGLWIEIFLSRVFDAFRDRKHFLKPRIKTDLFEVQVQRRLSSLFLSCKLFKYRRKIRLGMIFDDGTRLLHPVSYTNFSEIRDFLCYLLFITFITSCCLLQYPTVVCYYTYC